MRKVSTNSSPRARPPSWRCGQGSGASFNARAVGISPGSTPANARKAATYGLGLNWYLNENLKWVLNYEHTNFDGGAASGADRADEDVFLTRFGLTF